MDCRRFNATTYNVNRNDLESARITRIARRIHLLNAGVIGFQEVTGSLLPTLRKVLPEKSYGVYEGVVYEDLVCHPIFWKKEMFEIIPGTECTQYLGQSPHLPCQFPGAITVRMASSVILQPRNVNKRLFVLNTQLDNKSFDAREAGMRQLLDYCSGWPEDFIMQLFMGDLNFNTSGPNLTPMMTKPGRMICEAGFVDVWAEANHGVPQSRSFHGGKGTAAPPDRYTHSPDHIYARGLQVLGCKVEVESDSELTSDHYAMSAKLRFMD